MPAIRLGNRQQPPSTWGIAFDWELPLAARSELQAKLVVCKTRRRWLAAATLTATRARSVACRSSWPAWRRILPRVSSAVAERSGDKRQTSPRRSVNRGLPLGIFKFSYRARFWHPWESWVYCVDLLEPRLLSWQFWLKCHRGRCVAKTLAEYSYLTW